MTQIPAQVLTTVSSSVPGRDYRFLDLNVNVAGEDFPLIVDEKGRMCVLSRVCSLAAGYKQKDTIYRMVVQRGHRDLVEGLHFRMETADFMQKVAERLSDDFPLLHSVYSRVRGEEVVLYTESFPVLQRLSKMDLTALVDTIRGAEKVLKAPKVSADEALVDRLTESLVTDPVQAALDLQQALQEEASMSTPPRSIAELRQATDPFKIRAPEKPSSTDQIEERQVTRYVLNGVEYESLSAARKAQTKSKLRGVFAYDDISPQVVADMVEEILHKAKDIAPILNEYLAS